MTIDDRLKTALKQAQAEAEKGNWFRTMEAASRAEALAEIMWREEGAS